MDSRSTGIREHEILGASEFGNIRLWEHLTLGAFDFGSICLLEHNAEHWEHGTSETGLYFALYASIWPPMAHYSSL